MLWVYQQRQLVYKRDYSAFIVISFFTRGLYDKSVIKQPFGLTFRMTFEVNMIYLYTLVIFYSL